MGAEQTTVDGSAAPGGVGNVITVRGVNRSCIIEDLTVRGGRTSHPDSVGSGIYLNQYSSPTIQRCRLIDNKSRAGGGLSAYFHCEPLIRDCWVGYNEGGGLFFELGLGDRGSTWTEVQNTVVAHNTGSAVEVLKGARVRVRNATLAHNSGGGIFTSQSAIVVVQNSIVSHNGGSGIERYDPTVCFTMACNDVYGNEQGSYIGTNPVDACFSGRGSGDVSIEPCFQNVSADNFHLQRGSPLCALRIPGACGIVGAYDDVCVVGDLGNCVTTVTPSTWSDVKSFYR
jgi:hypothetical protein